jgi:hypothetical protein
MKAKYPNTQAPDHRKKSPVVDFDDADLTRGEEEFWSNGDDSEPAALHDDFNNGKPYDLEERTARFGEAIIRFAKKIPRGPGNGCLGVS